MTPIYEPAVDGWHTALLFTETSQMYEANQPGISVQLNNNTEKFADNPLMLQALGQLKELSDLQCFGDSFASDSYADAYDKMASGEYAMCMMRPGEISRIVASEQNAVREQNCSSAVLVQMISNMFKEHQISIEEWLKGAE